MTMELLISTMHQKDFALLDRLNIYSDAVVINQCDRNSSETFLYHGHRIKWLNTTKRGLSASRNEAIRNATADICLIADDDMEYREDYPQIVLTAFEKTGADIIGFQVRGIEKQFKHYSGDSCRVSYIRSMKMSSVELAIKRLPYINRGISFNEMIGAGTKYLMGEENAMLIQCLKKKMKIHYYPEVIADLHIGESSWFDGYHEPYFVGRGAAFTAMDQFWSGALILQFAVRKRHLYQHEMPMHEAIRYMFRGRQQYLQEVRQK